MCKNSFHNAPPYVMKQNLGNKYRRIRKSKHISIEKATLGITSKSHLSEWENGKAKMDVETCLALLERINIEPYDFFKQNGVAKIHLYTDDVIQMYANNDAASLKELIMILQNNYSLNSKNKTTFFKLAIAANFYLDLTNKNLLTDKEISLLRLELSNIDDWYVEDIIVFGNTQLLLNPQHVYEVSRSLISYSVESNQLNNGMILNTLLNATFVLIKKRSVTFAKKLLHMLKKQDISSQYTFEIIRIQFMNILIEFINTKDEKKIQSFFNSLKYLKLDQQAEDFQFAFSQIKEIYK